MEVVLLVVHLFITLAMTAVILLQRSEGGGLGIGGSSTPGGGLFSARGTANVLTRSTAFLGTAFFITSITLTVMAYNASGPASIIDGATPAPVAPSNAPMTPLPLDPGSPAPTQPDAAPPAGETPAEPAPTPSTPIP